MFDEQIAGIAARMPACKRVMAAPGIGVLTATVLVAVLGDPSEFRNGREMAAWLGLVPRQRSTGGRPTLLGISKRGDRYVRTLLIHGARSPPGARRSALSGLLETQPSTRSAASRYSVSALKRLQMGYDYGSHGTLLRAGADGPHPARTRHQGGQGNWERRKHAVALVNEWRRQGRTIGTMKNRTGHLRWWA